MRPRAGRRIVSVTGVAVAALVLLPLAGDAILVAPHAVFIDHRTRSGQIFLVNTGTVPEEVAIDLKFGYPDADSLGGVYVRLFDNPDSTQPSAAGWIRAFPRRTIVQPGERQSVRLLAQPPLGLPDGEYWSRLLVTSQESRPVPVATDSAVRTGINVQVRTILSITYRKGAVTTSVTMTEFAPEVTRDSLIVWMGLHRDGTAAYLGSVDLDLRDPQGRARGSWRVPVAVYYTVRRRFAFPLEAPAEPGGPYAVRVRVSTARDDLPATNILPALPVRDSAQVVLR